MMRGARLAAIWLAALAAVAAAAAAAPTPVESPRAARADTGTPELTFSPATLDFGKVAVGQGPTKTITLTNTGTAVLSIEYLHMEGKDRGEFGIIANHCGSSMSAGDSCTLTIQCSPENPFALYAFIYVESNSPNSPQTAEVVAYGIN
jgi:hypothetical protein